MNRPRFALIVSLLSLIGLGRPPQKLVETPVHLPASAATNMPFTGYGRGLPHNNAKDFGMSSACARMVRKNRLSRMGIAHSKI